MIQPIQPFLTGIVLVVFVGLHTAHAHEHIAAGATTPDQDAALLFVNAAVFAAESGYVIRLNAATNGPFAGHHHADLTFVCLAATSDLGGPVPFHPALGSHIEAIVESVDGPATGAFGFWESNGDTGIPRQLTFSVSVGETNGTHQFPVSENDGSPGADPYGHIHGRVFSATLPGLYRVGFRFVDTSANGRNGLPQHTPSARFYLNFQAGVTLAGIAETAEGIELTYATASDFTYVVEATTALETPDWQPVSVIEAGDDHLRTVTVGAVAGSARFFRLRRESQ